MNYILLPMLALLVLFIPPVFASTGMSDCTSDPDREDCNEQPDRVGNDGNGANNNDADRDGPGGADNDPNDDDTGEANCWGKVTSSLTKNDDGKPGIGEHTSDPFPGDDDNETPREGVGNQKSCSFTNMAGK